MEGGGSSSNSRASLFRHILKLQTSSLAKLRFWLCSAYNLFYWKLVWSYQLLPSKNSPPYLISDAIFLFVSQKDDKIRLTVRQSSIYLNLMFFLYRWTFSIFFCIEGFSPNFRSLACSIWKNFPRAFGTVGLWILREISTGAWKFHMWEFDFFTSSDMEKYHMKQRHLYKLKCKIHALNRRFS